MSGRLKLDFGAGVTAQVSYGYLKHPEELTPGSQHRLTASIQYGAAGDRPLAVSLIWGRLFEDLGVSDSVLLEGAWQITESDQVFGRAEWVEKDVELLATKLSEGGPFARVDAYTIGYFRDLAAATGLRVGIGGHLTAYALPGSLRSAYGAAPLSGHVFLRLRWQHVSM